MNITDLLTLSEAATGFVGGNYEDEMAGMSLSECAAMLPRVITETQIENYELTRKQNDAIVEASISAIQTGSMSESAVAELNELSFKDIQAKIMNFFTKIKKFLKSIIAKITLQIDKTRMTGRQLWSKYGSSPALKDTSKFKEFTYEGYKFNDSIKFGDFNDPEGPPRLVRDAYGGANITPSDARSAFHDVISGFSPRDPVKEGEEKDDAYARRGEKVDKIIETLADVSKSDRILNMVKSLTGINDLADDWKEDLRKTLYGEKETLNYGSDFTVDSIGKICQNPVNLDAIKNEYIKLEQGVHKYEKKLKDELDTYTKGSSDSTFSQTVLSKVTAYYQKYLDGLSDAYGTISTVKSIRIGFEEAKMYQAKSILGKLISVGGKKKVDNNDAEVDDDAMFELEM